MYFVRKMDRTGEKRAVYIYRYVDGRPVPLSRKLTKHLDSEPDNNVRYWMAEWAAREGVIPPVAAGELVEPALRAWVARFIDFLRQRKKARKTVESHERALLRLALPSLLDLDPGNTDFNQWPQQVSNLWLAMEKRGVTKNDQRLANVSLRQFWKWLGGQPKGHIHRGTQLVLYSSVQTERTATRLGRAMAPSEVLQFIREELASGDADAGRGRKRPKGGYSGHRSALMALLGYFFSLRPQEIFAAERKWFVAGSRAAHLQCCINMREAGLTRLSAAYDVQFQRDEDELLKPPKVDSVGWVASFSDEASRLLQQILPHFPDIGYLIPIEVPSLYVHWRRHGIRGISLKDLRRASMHWLGHNSKLTPIQLQKHTRHVDFSSTQHYLAEPEAAPPPSEVEDFDLDA